MSQTQEQEADLKAVFMYNFSKYIEWDSSNFLQNTFLIGVIGPSDVTAALQQIANSKTYNNKKIKVIEFSKPEDITFCNILFIPANLKYSLESILSRTYNGMVTVSEQSGYAKEGTAFNFYINNEKLKFEINLTALSNEGVKVSSQLLKLGNIIQ